MNCRGWYFTDTGLVFYGGSSVFPLDRQGGLKPGRGNVVDRRIETFLCAVRAVTKFYDIFSMTFRCLSGFLSGVPLPPRFIRHALFRLVFRTGFFVI